MYCQNSLLFVTRPVKAVLSVTWSVYVVSTGLFYSQNRRENKNKWPICLKSLAANEKAKASDACYAWGNILPLLVWDNYSKLDPINLIDQNI